SHNRSGSADTQSNGGPPKRHALRIYFRARTAPPAASAPGRTRVTSRRPDLPCPTSALPLEADVEFEGATLNTPEDQLYLGRSDTRKQPTQSNGVAGVPSVLQRVFIPFRGAR